MKKEDKYILVDGKVVVEPNLAKWNEWHEKSMPERQIEDTKIGGVRISTVFLSLDHNRSDSGPPILFETVIFGGEYDGCEERYTNLEDAKAGHKRAVDLIPICSNE